MPTLLVVMHAKLSNHFFSLFTAIAKRREDSNPRQLLSQIPLDPPGCSVTRSISAEDRTTKMRIAITIFVRRFVKPRDVVKILKVQLNGSSANRNKSHNLKSTFNGIVVGVNFFWILEHSFLAPASPYPLYLKLPHISFLHWCRATSQGLSRHTRRTTARLKNKWWLYKTQKGSLGGREETGKVRQRERERDSVRTLARAGYERTRYNFVEQLICQRADCENASAGAPAPFLSSSHPLAFSSTGW